MATGWLTLVALQPHWSTLGARLKAVSAPWLATPHSFFWLEKMEGACSWFAAQTARELTTQHIFALQQMQGVEFQLIASQSGNLALGRVHYFDHPLTWVRVTALRAQADQCNAFLFGTSWDLFTTQQVSATESDPRSDQICPRKRIICLIGNLSKLPASQTGQI